MPAANPWASRLRPPAGRACAACPGSVSRRFGCGSHTLQGLPPACTAGGSAAAAGDIGVIQVGMIAALAADQLEHIGVAAFHPAVHDPAAGAARYAVLPWPGWPAKGRATPASASRRNHGSQAMARPARCIDRMRTARQLVTGRASSPACPAVIPTGHFTPCCPLSVPCPLVVIAIRAGAGRATVGWLTAAAPGPSPPPSACPVGQHLTACSCCRGRRPGRRCFPGRPG